MAEKNLCKLIILVASFSFLANLGLAANTPVFTSKDALCDLPPQCSGLNNARKWVSAQSQILNTLTFTPNASKVFRFLTDVFQGLSLERLLDSHFAFLVSDETRAFTWTGSNGTDGYLVDFHKAPLKLFSPNKFMDMELQFGIRYNREDKNLFGPGYGLSYEGFLQSDELNHKAHLRLLTNQIRVLHSDNLKKMHPNKTRFFGNNQGLARALIDDLASTLPRYVSFVDEFSWLSLKLEPKKQENVEFLSFELRAQVDVESVKDSYPHLGYYLERMMRFLHVKSKSDLRTKDGLTILTTVYKSDIHEISLIFNTYGGAIIPQAEDGRLVFGRAIVPSEVTQFDGLLATSMDIAVYGLKIETGETEVSVSYRDGIRAELTSHLVKMPIPSFKGALFGIMPPTVLDFMMPGSLKEYSKMLAYGMVRGNNGKGSYARLEIDSSNSQKTVVRSVAATELIDNFYLKIGLRIINDYLWPSDQTLEEFRSFLAAGTGELLNDFESFPLQTGP
jgi:hypothetical protein